MNIHKKRPPMSSAHGGKPQLSGGLGDQRFRDWFDASQARLHLESHGHVTWRHLATSGDWGLIEMDHQLISSTARLFRMSCHATISPCFGGPMEISPCVGGPMRTQSSSVEACWAAGRWPGICRMTRAWPRRRHHGFSAGWMRRIDRMYCPMTSRRRCSRPLEFNWVKFGRAAFQDIGFFDLFRLLAWAISDFQVWNGMVGSSSINFWRFLHSTLGWNMLEPFKRMMFRPVRRNARYPDNHGAAVVASYASWWFRQCWIHQVDPLIMTRNVQRTNQIITMNIN